MLLGFSKGRGKGLKWGHKRGEKKLGLNRIRLLSSAVNKLLIKLDSNIKAHKLNNTCQLIT
jgi:hypothetical protein